MLEGYKTWLKAIKIENKVLKDEHYDVDEI